MPEPEDNQALREEFNRWAVAGRGEEMEEDHLPITLPVLDLMQLSSEDNVLDVGCGAGWLERLLSERVPEGRVVGMDISDEMGRRGRRNHVALENTMFVTDGAHEIPWDANFFTRGVSGLGGFCRPRNKGTTAALNHDRRRVAICPAKTALK